MSEASLDRKLQAGVKKYALIAAAVWTVVIAASVALHFRDASESALDLAHIQARRAFEKDLVYRRWAARNGGVYVPPTEETPPNPYLSHIENRDVTTTSGLRLTLVNPAYMTRQVHELGREQYGHQGHITSLNPLRAENSADPWEVKALRRFERGETEVTELARIGDVEHLRLMRPLITEESCLKCHAEQGYEVGDLRGGISVSVPMSPLWAVMHRHIAFQTVGYSLVWLLGLGGIGFGASRMTRRIRERDRAMERATRFHLVLENSLNEIYVFDAETLHYIEVNRGARLNLGYSMEELRALTPLDLIPEFTSASFEELAAPLRVGAQEKIEFVTVQRRKDGTLYPVEVHLQLMRGDTSVFVAINLDITVRKREKEHIDFQVQLLESVRESIVATDMEGRITYWGKGAETLYGYRAEEVLGKIVTFVAEADENREAERMAQVLDTGTWHGEYMQRRKDGSPFWCETTVSLVHDQEGWTRGTISIDRNITEHKRVQDEIRRSRETLRALAAHLESVREENRTQIARELHDELGHALTGLKIDLASLERRLSKPSEEENLSFVREKLAAMSEIIDATVKSVRRIATELRPGMLDDLGLMAAVEWQTGEFQERTGIMCEVDLAQSLWLGEERTTAVFRIFQETLTNIARHAKATKVRVSMREKNENLILEVSDNGRGISDAEIAAPRSFGLLGIRERALILDGDVSIVGIPGEGTTVRVKIPRSPTKGGEDLAEDSSR